MQNQDPEKIPLFKKGNRWYALVLGFLALLVVLFYLFTKNFS
jgi:hypothetical protein